jgi:purine-binding chemotaxis protein CheW
MVAQEKLAICTIGTEEFALPISDVKEIVSIGKVFKIPDLPNYITGMINLRGFVYVVYDLRVRFNMDSSNLEDPKILIMNDKKVGLVVDEVSEILTVNQEAFDNTTDYPDLNLKNFISNIIKHDGRVIINLDMKSLINKSDEVIIEEILEN